jgi:hypothetical protein
MIGEDAPGLGGIPLEAPGRRTSRNARAPQLIRRANGLLGLPEAGSESSMALSSCTDEEDEIEDTDPRLNAYPVESFGGDPFRPDRLIRRWLFA